MPSEAEWEYAARAGTTTDRYGDIDAVAWYMVSSTQPVGQKVPNAWRLHDMLGNIWEWVADLYGAYPGGSVTDPQGPSFGSLRVLRGGGWNFVASATRAPYRAWEDEPGLRGFHTGFRLARTDH